jgi:hypothetical protein
MRERIILWLQRRRKGNKAMPAFPGRSKLYVREKAVGSCVERGAATPVHSHVDRLTQADCIHQRESDSEFHDFLPCTCHFIHSHLFSDPVTCSSRSGWFGSDFFSIEAVQRRKPPISSLLASRDWQSMTTNPIASNCPGSFDLMPEYPQA